MSNTDSEKRAQIVYFSHGGGPLPILGDPGHKAMVGFMQSLPSKLRRPDAILVISAHWEESVPTLLGADRPELFYDYYGFPDEAYRVTYPAPGSPELARKVSTLLNKRGIPSRIDLRRGYDHGLFIPLMLMYPEADIPSLQISLVQRLDPVVHIALGKALGELLNDNILIIGSGFSFHNLREFQLGRNSMIPDSQNDAFQEWLIETCTGPRSECEQRLTNWERAPFARYCHPREEHLLPLQVCVGMAETPARLIFDDYIAGKRAVAFLWG